MIHRLDRLTDAQTRAIPDRKQHAGLQIVGDGKQASGFVGAETLRQLTGSLIWWSPVIVRLRVWIEVPVSVRCSWNSRTSSTVALSGERFSQAANRLQARM